MFRHIGLFVVLLVCCFLARVEEVLTWLRGDNPRPTTDFERFKNVLGSFRAGFDLVENNLIDRDHLSLLGLLICLLAKGQLFRFAV
jgi:hypothetical protein